MTNDKQQRAGLVPRFTQDCLEWMLYKNPNVQWAIAGMIMGNFSTNIVEKQIDPTGLVYASEWKVIENIWNSIFVLELIWNMAAHWAITVSSARIASSRLRYREHTF